MITKLSRRTGHASEPSILELASVWLSGPPPPAKPLHFLPPFRHHPPLAKSKPRTQGSQAKVGAASPEEASESIFIWIRSCDIMMLRL